MGSWEWDLDTGTVRWSDELYRIYGIEQNGRPPLIQQITASGFEGDRARFEGALAECLRSRKPVQGEFRILRPDGRIRNLVVNCETVSDNQGRALRLMGTAQDVTDQRMLQHQESEQAKTLAELEQLKELNRFKTAFINSAAHELGNPLTPIRLQIHLLKIRLEDRLDAETRKSFEVLDRNISRMILLVGDILEGARLQASRLAIKKAPGDLSQLARDAIESFRGSAADAGIEITYKGDLTLTAPFDQKRLSQVLFNLLSNAVKFTPRGGTIAVEVGRQRDQAIVSVIDNGQGIRPENLARLFQPFSQVRESDTNHPVGTGLGLYICRGFLELHDGTIWAESEGLGHGSSFRFAIPLTIPTTAPTMGDVVPTAGLKDRLKKPGT